MYNGIFHAALLEKGFEVVLKMADRKQTSDESAMKPIETMIIPGGDVVSLTADTVLLAEDLPAAVVNMASGPWS